MRKLGHKIKSTHLSRINTQLSSSHINETLNNISGFRATRATIGVYGCCVGITCYHMAVNRWNIVLT